MNGRMGELRLAFHDRDGPRHMRGWLALKVNGSRSHLPQSSLRSASAAVVTTSKADGHGQHHFPHCVGARQLLQGSKNREYGIRL